MLASSPTVSASSGVLVGGGPISGPTAFAVVSGTSSTDWATVSGGQVMALAASGYANDLYAPGRIPASRAGNPSPAAFTTDTLAFRANQANTLTLSGLNTLNLGGISWAPRWAPMPRRSAAARSLPPATSWWCSSTTLAAISPSMQLVNNGGTPLVLTKAGPGTLVLGNAANNYSGGTVIGGGTVICGAAGALDRPATP